MDLSRSTVAVSWAFVFAHVAQPARRPYFLRDVLGDLYDRRRGRTRVDRGEGRDAQNLLVGERDLGSLGAGEGNTGAVVFYARFFARRGVYKGASDGTGRAAASAQADLSA